MNEEEWVIQVIKIILAVTFLVMFSLWADKIIKLLEIIAKK